MLERPALLPVDDSCLLRRDQDLSDLMDKINLKGKEKREALDAFTTNFVSLEMLMTSVTDEVCVFVVIVARLIVQPSIAVKFRCDATFKYT